MKMTEVPLLELQRHVERLHGCGAEYRESVAVQEEFQGRVHIFSLHGHIDDAGSCYAWSSPVEGSESRRFYAVLHTDEIDSPAKAVRAAIGK